MRQLFCNIERVALGPLQHELCMPYDQNRIDGCLGSGHTRSVEGSFPVQIRASIIGPTQLAIRCSTSAKFYLKERESGRENRAGASSIAGR